MTEAALQPVNLGPVVASRRLFNLTRHLIPIEYSLADMLDSRLVAIPPLTDDAAGYRFMSIPTELTATLMARLPDMSRGLDHRFQRRFIDMRAGMDAYLAGFSSKTRSTLRRKVRKLAKEDGGTLDIRRYDRPDELDQFFAQALPLSAKTYQDRLLDAGLPSSDDFRSKAHELARQDRLRAFLLFLDGKPISYLYLPIEGASGRESLVYQYLGYDPDYANLSPGTVLQMEALALLFEEKRFAWFDFTSGDGAHKKLFATSHVDGANFVMLRPNLTNAMLLGGLNMTDRAVSFAGDVSDKLGLKSALRRAIKRG